MWLFEKDDFPMPAKEEVEFLKLREKLKAKIRQEHKKQSADDFGDFSHLLPPPDSKRAVTNDKYGSFFGPSQPAIAPRVLEESRSIWGTQLSVAKDPSFLSLHKNKSSPVSASTKASTQEHNQPQKDANEVKSKAKALKDMRDYTSLFSDEADLPDPPKNNNPANKPSNLVSSGHKKNSAPINQYKLPKVGLVKPASAECRKTIRVGCRNEHKALPSKVSSQVISVGKTSAKVQTSHHKDHPKKRPVGMDYDEDVDGAFEMLRRITGYNPDKYVGVDDRDDCTMEAGFDEILKEERRSAKIARKEDAEELRLVEKEERRERTRKKQKNRDTSDGSEN